MTVFTIADALMYGAGVSATGFVAVGVRRVRRALAARPRPPRRPVVPGRPMEPPPGERVDGPVVLPWPVVPPRPVPARREAHWVAVTWHG